MLIRSTRQIIFLLHVHGPSCRIVHAHDHGLTTSICPNLVHILIADQCFADVRFMVKKFLS